MFDYKGYDEEKLMKLSNEQTIPYILQEAYSFGKLIREYGYYPSLLPLNIYHQHGAGRVLANTPYKHDLESKAYYMFVNNCDDIQMYNDAGMNCCVMLHPFIYYRNSRKIEKSKYATGTIVFPSHITPDVDDLSDTSVYIEQLLKLPEIYKPLCICMSWVDITHNRHKIWMQYGFPVYTVGHAYHEDFVKRFYDLIRNFKFMTSNSIGSQTYYAVEMGIPFFLYGEEPMYYNKSDPYIEAGYMDLHKRNAYKKAYNLFNHITTEITAEQKKFVLDGLGIKDGITRVNMMKILYLGFLKSNRVTKSITRSCKYLYTKYILKKDKQDLNFLRSRLFLKIYGKQ
jgi:hypothetical protein